VHPIYIWFLGPTRVCKPNGISISSAVYARLTVVTNTQKDIHTTFSVVVGRVYALHAMRPKCDGVTSNEGSLVYYIQQTVFVLQYFQTIPWPTYKSPAHATGLQQHRRYRKTLGWDRRQQSLESTVCSLAKLSLALSSLFCRTDRQT